MPEMGRAGSANPGRADPEARIAAGRRFQPPDLRRRPAGEWSALRRPPALGPPTCQQPPRTRRAGGVSRASSAKDKAWRTPTSEKGGPRIAASRPPPRHISPGIRPARCPQQLSESRPPLPWHLSRPLGIYQGRDGARGQEDSPAQIRLIRLEPAAVCKGRTARVRAAGRPGRACRTGTRRPRSVRADSGRAIRPTSRRRRRRRYCRRQTGPGQACPGPDRGPARPTPGASGRRRRRWSGGRP
jgi:hypothetical protein